MPLEKSKPVGHHTSVWTIGNSVCEKQQHWGRGTVLWGWGEGGWSWCLEGLRQDQWTKGVVPVQAVPHVGAEALGDVLKAINRRFLQSVFLPRPGWCAPGQPAVFQPFPLEDVEWRAKRLPCQPLYFCIVLRLMRLWHPFLVNCNYLLHVDIVQKGARDVQTLERSGSGRSCKLRERRLNLLSNLGQIT